MESTKKLTKEERIAQRRDRVVAKKKSKDGWLHSLSLRPDVIVSLDPSAAVSERSDLQAQVSRSKRQIAESRQLVDEAKVVAKYIFALICLNLFIWTQFEGDYDVSDIRVERDHNESLRRHDEVIARRVR